MRRRHGIRTFLPNVSTVKDFANDDQLESLAPTRSSRFALSPLFSFNLTVLLQLERSSLSSRYSILKRYEVVKKDQGTSTDPTFQGQQQFGQKVYEPVSTNSEFCHTPVYRRYFGFTPPNPRLSNPRVLGDYIDWYMNVYLNDDFPWQWFYMGNVQDKMKRVGEEVQAQAEKSASTSSTSSTEKSNTDKG